MNPDTSVDPRPFATLDPDCVLDALESLGLQPDGSVLALNSFENRVFRIGMRDGPARVAKFYRPGRWSDDAIAEEHAFAAELADAEVPVVAPLPIDGATLHRFREHRFALFPLRGGHAPELDHRDNLNQLGRLMGRLHRIGATRKFRHRPQLSIERFGRESLRTLGEVDSVPPYLRDNLLAAGSHLIAAIESAWQRTGQPRMLRLHGDCHPGNMLSRDGVLHFVDLDDCLTGPAMQDLWMLLSGTPDDQRRQLGWLLEGYREFADFDLRELHLIEALRGLRLLHYNAWIAGRWDDPAFPAAFVWFAEPRHWESLINQFQEQMAALQEPAIEAPI